MSHVMQPPTGEHAGVQPVDDDIESELQQSDREACGGYLVVGSAWHAEPPTMPHSPAWRTPRTRRKANRT